MYKQEHNVSENKVGVFFYHHIFLEPVICTINLWDGCVIALHFSEVVGTDEDEDDVIIWVTQ